MFGRMFLCVFMALGAASAQDAREGFSLHPFVGGSVGFSGGLGYENPSFGAEGGMETNVHRFLSVTSAEIARADSRRYSVRATR